MRKTSGYTAISFILIIASSLSAGYTNDTTNKNNSRVDDVEKNLPSPTRWQLVKHAFQLHINHLRGAFGIFIKYNMKNLAKCVFGVFPRKFLGFMVT